ncbi:AzlD domain-containing protein [Bacillus massiliglaciei]|uniref:AzlD domain-containing protein n=1 Tax=Bacillus massiliglaciei TaxID=1816693 RepID=UPI000DA61063|nr:AzlD domain-containing protein [Bacillus massiliglaciei]
MEVSLYVLSVIAGTAIVTVIPRVLPLVLLSQLQIPEWGINWLKHVPVAVLAALLAQELVIEDSKINVSTHSLELLAAVPALLVALYTRSLLGTVLAGVGSLFLLRFFI